MTLRLSQLTSYQLSSILAARSHHTLRSTLHSIRNTSASLEAASGHTRQSTTHLLDITKDNHRDARSMKALSQLAIMYLPASLVAAIFSTDLLSGGNGDGMETGDCSAVKGNRPLVMYFAITTPLLIATALFIVWLEKACSSGRWMFRSSSASPGGTP
jgi:hypothetical protein